MLFWCGRFNLYFALASLLLLACACQTPEKARKKRLSTLRVHLESSDPNTNRTVTVQVYRSSPVTMQMDRAPVVTEEKVKAARVVEGLGGFALQIELDREGGWLLEQYTSNNRGKHLLIFSQFAVPENPKLEVARWLAAPLITGPISNGILLFTPDATRDESEQVAIGLNNVSKKLHTGEEPNW